MTMSYSLCDQARYTKIKLAASNWKLHKTNLVLTVINTVVAFHSNLDKTVKSNIYRRPRYAQTGTVILICSRQHSLRDEHKNPSEPSATPMPRQQPPDTLKRPTTIYQRHVSLRPFVNTNRGGFTLLTENSSHH